MPLCECCQLRADLCLCGAIHPLDTVTRVVLLVHSLEIRKASNTARLVARVLKNSEVRLQGVRDAPLNLEGLVSEERETLVLFPETSSPPIVGDSTKRFNKPVTLLVPDGSWQQARKIAAHASMLPGVRRISLPSGSPSRYRLRTAKNASHLCTLEAVARAIGALESPEAQSNLESVLDLLVERSLVMRKRGQKRATPTQ